MAPKPTKAEKKIAYDAKLCQLLDEYSQILVASADNVGSNQLQNIRRGLRGDSVVLMGKNTMMKRSVRIHSENTGNKTFLNLLPCLVVCLFLFLFSISILSFIYCCFCLVLTFVLVFFLGQRWIDLHQG